VVLGRLLAPTDFGVVAMAMTVMMLAQTIRDVGVGVALVQRKELSAAHIEAGFGFSIALGVVLAAGLVLAAPAIGAAYQPAVVPILRGLAVLFVLRGIASVPQALLQRAFDFRVLTQIDASAYALGSLVSIVAALTGAGAWALVIGYLFEASVNVALLLVVRRPPRPRFDRARLRELLGFGGGMTLAQLANYVATQGDYVVVGRALQAAALGFYTRAYELVRFPASTFTSVVGNVLFSALARLQEQPERLARAYRRVLLLNAAVLLPASAALVVLAPELIATLMGPGWSATVLPFRVLAITMTCRTGYKIGGIVATSSGQAAAIAACHAIYAVLVVGGALATVRWGITGVAASTSFAIAMTFVSISWLAVRRAGLRGSAFLAVHGVGLGCAAPVLVGVVPMASLLRGVGAPAPLIVVAAGAVGAAGFLATAWLAIRRWPESDAAWAWATLRGMLSRRGDRRAAAASI
jgi:PST family polysaccharide transporter